MQIRSPILRYYVPAQGREEHLATLLETCHAIGIQEVLLFTEAYLHLPVFLDDDSFKAKIDHLHFCAEHIRQAGLTFSLNVLNTLGHVYVAQEEVDQFGFERQIDRNGNPARHPALDPCCERLRQYVVKAYHEYAKLNPRIMFVDDDFLVSMNNCFHANRLGRFANEYGCGGDLQTIAALVFSEDQAVQKRARQLMFRLISSDLKKLAVLLRHSVHGHNSEIMIGIMHPRKVFFDITEVAKALAGPHRPLIRPQLSIYSEATAVTAYAKSFWDIAYWKAKLPEDTNLVPEVENYPYCTELKSPAAAFAQAAACFGCGEMQIGLSVNSNPTGITDSSSRPLVDIFASHHGQIKFLAELLASHSKPTGIGVWEAGSGRAMETIPETSFSWLQLMGLPIYSARFPSQAVIHCGADIHDASSAEIDKIMCKGALLDLEAAEILRQSGKLERAELTLHDRCTFDQVFQADLSGETSYGFWPMAYFIYRNMDAEELSREVACPQPNILASCYDKYRQPSVPLLLTWQNSKGTRFGLINAKTRTWPGPLWQNPWMPKIINQAVEYITDSTTLVRISDGCNITAKALELSSPQKKQLLITLCNHSTSAQNDVRLALASQLAHYDFAIIEPDGSLLPLRPAATEHRTDVLLKKKLDSLGVCFILATKEE